MMNQYMLLLSSSMIGMPTDLWVPVTHKIRPQQSQQVALGMAYEPKKLGTTFSIEGYYKNLEHVVAYLPGASFMSGFEDAMGGIVNRFKLFVLKTAYTLQTFQKYVFQELDPVLHAMFATYIKVAVE